MSHRICKYCNKPVVLKPSATERALKFGGSPKDYLDLFPYHSDCMVKNREQETLELIKRKQNKTEN